MQGFDLVRGAALRLLSRVGTSAVQGAQAAIARLWPLSPVLHYNRGQRDLVGGNFWDMRATCRRLGTPAAEQVEGPPTNPVEMGLTAGCRERVERRLAAILAADVAGYSRLMGADGDGTLAALKAIRSIPVGWVEQSETHLLLWLR